MYTSTIHKHVSLHNVIIMTSLYIVIWPTSRWNRWSNQIHETCLSVCLSVRAAESGWILWRDLDSFSSHLILSHLHQAAEILLCFSFITEVDSHETASLTYENHFFYHSWLHLSVSSFIHWLIFSPFVWLFSHCFLMSVCQVYLCPSLPTLTSDLWPNQLLPHLSSLFINVYSSSNLHQFTPRYCSCMHSSSAASGWQQMNSGGMRCLSLNTVTTALWFD